jgi:hypothetical protein
MEHRMRQCLCLAAILIGAAIGVGASPQDADAGPPAAISIPAVSSSMVDKAGWRRYCRRYGCGPDVVAPDAQVDIDVAVPDADIGADTEAPAVIVLPPPRPLSCGQFRYWNGTACVDARYNDPYLGPR